MACRTVTVVHVGKRANSCGMCSTSLAPIKFVYLPAKGSVPEPRPRFCSGNCCKVWTDMRQAQLARRAAFRPHHAYNSNR